jgi:DNA modification methylase
MILRGDVREMLGQLADCSIQSCVTSPPYWGLRDYGHDGQIGLEQTPDEYVAEMVAVFREVRRVLKDDGVLWLNLGDSYSGSGKGPAGNLGAKHNERHLENKHSAIVPDGLKPKDLVGIPWRVAFALQADGWYLRQDIIWHKPNPMPESVTDRCTKSHEYLFLLTKSAKYYFDNEAIKEDAKWSSDKRAGAGRLTYNGKRQGTNGTGQEAFVSIVDKRNRRSVWTIPTKPFRGAHFAVMPEALVEPCILATSREGDTVLDPFLGSGTVGLVAQRHNRRWVGCELNPEYAKIAEERINKETNIFTEVS